MPKYPLKFPSASKGPVEIETMHDRHLLNAYRKRQTDHEADPVLLECLKEELDSRGLDPQYANGRPEPPAPEPDGIDEEGL